MLVYYILGPFPRGEHICTGEMGFPVAQGSGPTGCGVVPDLRGAAVLCAVKLPGFFPPHAEELKGPEPAVETSQRRP